MSNVKCNERTIPTEYSNMEVTNDFYNDFSGVVRKKTEALN